MRPASPGALALFALLAAGCGDELSPSGASSSDSADCSSHERRGPLPVAYSLSVRDAVGNVFFADLRPAELELHVGFSPRHLQPALLGIQVCEDEARARQLLAAAAALVDGPGTASAELSIDPNERILYTTTVLTVPSGDGYSVSYVRTEENMRCFAESLDDFLAACGVEDRVALSATPIIYFGGEPASAPR